MVGKQANREVLAISDFNGDGAELDILFQQTNNGFSFIALAATSTTSRAWPTHGSNLQRRRRLQRRRQGGRRLPGRCRQAASLVLNGGDTSAAEGAGIQNGRTLIGIADTQGDGSDDLIFKTDATGFVTILDDADPSHRSAVAIKAGNTLLAVADFNGDGTEDLLWEKDNTDCVYYFASGDAGRQSNIGDQTGQTLEAVQTSMATARQTCCGGTTAPVSPRSSTAWTCPSPPGLVFA